MRGISHLAGTGLPPRTPSLLPLFLSLPFNTKTPSPSRAGFINFPAAKHFINDWWTSKSRVDSLSRSLSLLWWLGLWMFRSVCLIQCLLGCCSSILAPAMQLSKRAMFEQHYGYTKQALKCKSQNNISFSMKVSVHMYIGISMRFGLSSTHKHTTF